MWHPYKKNLLHKNQNFGNSIHISMNFEVQKELSTLDTVKYFYKMTTTILMETQCISSSTHWFILNTIGNEHVI